jgi:hypothetical protein
MVGLTYCRKVVEDACVVLVEGENAMLDAV